MRFVISEGEDGKLLRTYLRERGVSAALLARLKREERGMLQNGIPVTVRAVLRAGDVVELAIEDTTPPVHVLPRDLPVEILLHTPDFTVCNKPANMPTHPSHGHFEDTLANALVYRLSTAEAPFCPRFVNRLDRNTTGVVLVANHALSAASLSRAMAQGQIKKRYLALVHGSIAAPVVIDADIRRRAESIIFREVCPKGAGEHALTEVTPLAEGNGMTLVALTPHTGRTHQLRVHLASIGHPLLGDDLYGYADGFSRHALHAHVLRFPNAKGEEIEVRAPVPQDMLAVIETLGKEALIYAK